MHTHIPESSNTQDVALNIIYQFILINKVSADDDEFVTLYVASDRTDEREGLT